MSEMREWWSNVYVDGEVGNCCRNTSECDWYISRVPIQAAFRIHVRLKPEGAPRRYADHLERDAWERDPGFVRALDRLIAGDPAPRTPKTEESAS